MESEGERECADQWAVGGGNWWPAKSFTNALTTASKCTHSLDRIPRRLALNIHLKKFVKLEKLANPNPTKAIRFASFRSRRHQRITQTVARSQFEIRSAVSCGVHYDNHTAIAWLLTAASNRCSCRPPAHHIWLSLYHPLSVFLSLPPCLPHSTCIDLSRRRRNLFAFSAIEVCSGIDALIYATISLRKRNERVYRWRGPANSPDLNSPPLLNPSIPICISKTNDCGRKSIETRPKWKVFWNHAYFSYIYNWKVSEAVKGWKS